MTDAQALADYIADAGRLVVFTGAGISTESGIPDFRSPGGVWTQMKPITFQEFVGSREMRREAWNRVFGNSARWVGAEPNTGHFAVAQLVHMGKAKAIITQNVDNLHAEAGAPAERIIELHGNASYAKCLKCETRYEIADLRPRWEAGEDITCPACGGYIKTATISFGQSMPHTAMRRAMEESHKSDLFIVLGSSLEVYPAASLPMVAKEAGAELVIVNRTPTPLDPYADLVCHTGIGALLTEAMGLIGGSALN